MRRPGTYAPCQKKQVLAKRLRSSGFGTRESRDAIAFTTADVEEMRTDLRMKTNAEADAAQKGLQWKRQPTVEEDALTKELRSKRAQTASADARPKGIQSMRQ